MCYIFKIYYFAHIQTYSNIWWKFNIQNSQKPRSRQAPRGPRNSHTPRGQRAPQGPENNQKPCGRLYINIYDKRSFNFFLFLYDCVTFKDAPFENMFFVAMQSYNHHES